MLRFLILFLISTSVFGLDYNPKLGRDISFSEEGYQREDLANYVLEWANYFNLDTDIVMAIVDKESSWRHNVVSNVGAIGLMQLMPQTAYDEGMHKHESLFNPYTNSYYGCKYVSKLLSRYQGNYFLALVAYYAGMRRADSIKLGTLPNGKFREEITNYAFSILLRSGYLEVAFGQQTKEPKNKKM